MKMKIHVCDICGQNLYKRDYPHPVRIKMKRYNDPWGDGLFPWEKMEICGKCAKKIYDYCKNAR